MLPWAVVDSKSGEVIGSTRYHDIVPAIDRVEIGYTWYASRWQRSHVNTASKLLLLTHAFESVGCQCVGLRTDNFNFRSQRARGTRCQTRWRPAPPRGTARWHRARQCHVQHSRGRVAGREAPPGDEIAAGWARSNHVAIARSVR